MSGVQRQRVEQATASRPERSNRVSRLLALATVGALLCSGCSDDDDDGSEWSTRANDTCLAFVFARWAEGSPYTDNAAMVDDFGVLVGDLAALPDPNDDARAAISGMQEAVQAMEAGESLNGLDWLTSLKDSGATTCWQIFQGPPAGG